jgi:hypothetical protein
MAGAQGHGGFAVLNRTVNPLLRGLLRSPLHRVASGSLALLTVTGRSSGRRYSFPVGYRREGEVVTIAVGAPRRKRWWRNLTGAGAPVEIRLAGGDYSGHALARGDESSEVTVEVTLAQP